MSGLGEHSRVARIGKPHGVRGEVSVEVLVQDLDTHLEPGTSLVTDPPECGPLTVATARWNKRILLLSFEGVRSRDQALMLRETFLLRQLPAQRNVAPGEDETWYESDLQGLRVLVDNQVVGEVVGLEPRAAQDLLVVRLTDGYEVLVPFVKAIVPEVSVEAGYLRLEPPEGLLSLHHRG